MASPRPTQPVLYRHRKTQSLLTNPMTAAIIKSKPQREKLALRIKETTRKAASVTRKSGLIECQKREPERVFYYFGKRDWKPVEI